jgi:acyl carrier protein
MRKNQIQLPACYEKIQLIIAVTTGNKVRDISPHSNLVTDLGLSLSFDLPEIVATLNHEYEADSLNLITAEVREELEAAEPTVLELAKIVQEVRDLG